MDILKRNPLIDVKLLVSSFFRAINLGLALDNTEYLLTTNKCFDDSGHNWDYRTENHHRCHSCLRNLNDFHDRVDLACSWIDILLLYQTATYRIGKEIESEHEGEE